MANATESVPIAAVRTTMQVVEALKRTDGAGVSELATELGMAKSTVHDHLTTLKRDGYVVETDRSYQVSARFLEIGGHRRSNTELFQVARPELDELAHETGEHANLLIEENGRGVFLYIARGENAVRVDTVHHTGMYVHLQTTSLGKAMLSTFPEDRVERILDERGMPQVNERTVTDRTELFEELERIREQGYATDDEERVAGMRCVGGPIAREEGTAVGAVSVSAPTSRMQGERFETEIPRLVRRTANIVEVNLAYS